MKYNENIKNDFIKLGKHIQNLREARKISLKEMSRKTGIRKDYLQKIEKGIAYGITLNTHLIKIANALNVSLVTLFEYDYLNKL